MTHQKANKDMKICIQSNQNLFRHIQHFSHYQFIRYRLENGNKI